MAAHKNVTTIEPAALASHDPDPGVDLGSSRSDRLGRALFQAIYGLKSSAPSRPASFSTWS